MRFKYSLFFLLLSLVQLIHKLFTFGTRTRSAFGRILYQRTRKHCCQQTNPMQIWLWIWNLIQSWYGGNFQPCQSSAGSDCCYCFPLKSWDINHCYFSLLRLYTQEVPTATWAVYPLILSLVLAVPLQLGMNSNLEGIQFTKNRPLTSTLVKSASAVHRERHTEFEWQPYTPTSRQRVQRENQLKMNKSFLGGSWME